MRRLKLFLLVPITLALFSSASVSPPKGTEKQTSQPSSGELATAATAEISDRIYYLPGHGAITFKVPVAWADKVDQPRDQSPPTIEFRQKKGPPFQVLVTPGWPKRPGVPPHSTEEIKAFMERLVEERKSTPSSHRHVHAKTSDVMEIKGSAGIGYYFSGIDSSTVGPRDFTHVTQGFIPVADLSVLFTILTNDGQEDIHNSAMNLIKTGVSSGNDIPVAIDTIRFPAEATIAELMIPAKELPGKCKVVDGEHGVSPQAISLYKLHETIGPALNISAEKKAYQSLKCGKVLATIYYYHYTNKLDALRAITSIRTLIWGDESPSALHPEIILSVNNIVVIVSSWESIRFERLMLDYWKGKYGT